MNEEVLDVEDGRMDVRKGMHVRKDVFHLGRSGMAMMKAKDKDTQCRGSDSGDESPKPSMGTQKCQQI